MLKLRRRPSFVPWIALASAFASLAVVGATAQTAGAAIATCSGTGGTFAGGSGTSADPFLVSNQAELEAIRTSTYVSCAFRQTADIALTGSWTPIGTGIPVETFTGEYDGNGKTISGLNLTGDNLTYEGLFGYTKGPALITDLFVRGSVTSNTGGFGLGVIGMADSGTVISNVHADVDVTATAGSILGGLVGWGPEVTIEESSAAGDVTGNSSVGGLIGQAFGRNQSSQGPPPYLAKITDSYATGNVTGSATGTGIGGLVGSLNGNDNRVIRSYATGQVTGGTSGGGTSGGLIGPQAGGTPYTGLTVTDSFWDTQTTGKATSANGLGTGKTTAQMKSFSTFSAANWNITDGWSASTVWGICDGSTYPFLRGQYTSSPCAPPPPPPPPTSVLAVNKSVADTGTGTVTSEPGGINCGTICVKTYDTAVDPAARVTLTATPAPGSKFTGWTGACTNQQGPCELTMNYTRVVTARFTAVDIHRLTVTKQGTGQGTVTSNPSGIDCGATCDSQFSQFNDEEVVTLTASASQGSTFTGWSGACSGIGPCQVTMDQARQVAATFTEDPPPPPPPLVSDVGIELNTPRPATVPSSRVLGAVRVSCEGDAPCRIDSASAKARAGRGSELNAPVTFSSGPFQAGSSQIIQVTIPQAVYDRLRKGRKSGLLTVNVRAQGTEGPRDVEIKVGLQR